MPGSEGGGEPDRTWPDGFHWPRVQWDGDDYTIAFETSVGGLVYFARLSAIGSVIGTSDVIDMAASGGGAGLDMQWNGMQHGIVHSDGRSGHKAVYFSSLDGDGAITARSAPVSSSTGDATSPAMAWTGSGYGVVWTDTRSGIENLFFDYVTCD